MDEGKLIADFIASNLTKIMEIANICYEKIDAKAQIKLKTAYTKYLSLTREKYSKSKSFFIRTEAVDLYSYYVPTGIRCKSIELEEPSFSECIACSKRFVITGTGGSGKTVLMKHLFLDCIASKKYVPILIELRDLNDGDKSLGELMEDTLNLFKFNTSGKYIDLAKKAGHFCFFLDGYDEVVHSERKNLIKEIKKLTAKNPDCPIFISSRPDDVFQGIDEFSIYKIMPLSLNSATKLISKLPFDEDIKNKFTEDLVSGLFEEHESFLSNPLLLSIMLLTYGENAEIPSKLSIFYNQAYEALFQRHDANKAGFSRERLTKLDIQDFSRVFSLFALQTYEKRQFKMPRTDALKYIEKSRDSLNFEFDANDYLKDLLGAACLLLEEGLEIAFSHRSFQEYFVALHMSTAAPDIQEKLIDRYWPKMTSDNVINLLLEINPDLVERVLLVPKLRMLFTKVGVKSFVGITHTAKFIKESYSTLNFEEDRISATVSKSEGSLSPIVHMAIQHCDTWANPGMDYFNSHKEEMLKKYGETGRRKQYPTKDMSYKTPVLRDTLKSRGAFSTEYLQSAYSAFKFLEKKHSKRKETLDELLGI